MEVADDLAGEPLVQLLVRVQHQALLLGPLFALGHQGGVLIAFEQTRDLGDKQHHAQLVLVTRPRNSHQCDRSLPHLSIGQKRIHSLQESRIQHVGFVHYKCYLFIFAARTSQHCPKVFVKVFPRVLPVDLRGQRQVRSSHPRSSVQEPDPCWMKSLRRPTLIWYTLNPFIQATNRDRVVFPAPLTPIRSKWP